MASSDASDASDDTPLLAVGFDARDALTLRSLDADMKRMGQRIAMWKKWEGGGGCDVCDRPAKGVP